MRMINMEKAFKTAGRLGELPIISATAFGLGWFMRGDIIYGGMFSQQVETVRDMLPAGKK